jgi:hypothetical protein
MNGQGKTVFNDKYLQTLKEMGGGDGGKRVDQELGGS